LKKYVITFGKNKIYFTVERRNRKSLKISVLPDLSVVAIAPLNVSVEDVKRKVKKRANWILKQKDYFNNFLPKEPPRRYISGETHRYLGRQYRIKIISSTQNDVKMKGKHIIIYSKDKNNKEHVKKLLNKWYREHAEKKFNTIIDSFIEKLSKHGIHKPDLQIKKMKSRWGSCDFEKKRIILNTELIKAPAYGIEYVIMHELCHLKYPNHDNSFYNFFSLVMPDWKERKARLEKAFV